jgi:hypothetical protein
MSFDHRGPGGLHRSFNHLVGAGVGVSPERVLIRIKKNRNIFLAKDNCFPRD